MASAIACLSVPCEPSSRGDVTVKMFPMVVTAAASVLTSTANFPASISASITATPIITSVLFVLFIFLSSCFFKSRDLVFEYSSLFPISAGVRIRPVWVFRSSRFRGPFDDCSQAGQVILHHVIHGPSLAGCFTHVGRVIAGHDDDSGISERVSNGSSCAETIDSL